LDRFYTLGVATAGYNELSCYAVDIGLKLCLQHWGTRLLLACNLDYVVYCFLAGGITSYWGWWVCDTIL